MRGQKLYSIGEVSRICNVSKKALRFYDKIGLIVPDEVSESNSYRYYNRETLLLVPVIKYYKQMGFKLDEMKRFLEADTYSVHERGFRKKIDELKCEQNRIMTASISVQDWYDLILEAANVIEITADEVSIKYMDSVTSCYLEQEFEYNYSESIINIDWTNYLESIDTEITGAVILCFDDAEAKMRGKKTKCRVFQKAIVDNKDAQVMTIGGYMAATCYHIGTHETINKTYEKIYDWANAKGYECDKSSVERYVTDYWTIRKSEEFVTEVSVKVTKKPDK